MKSLSAVLLLVVAVAVAGCSKKLSEAEVLQVQALTAELQRVRAEIADGERANAALAGGLVKALSAVRLEVQKTNEALIQQRIQAIESGAKVTVETVVSTVDLARAQQLEEEIKRQDAHVAEAEARAKDAGGLIGALAHMEVATHRNSAALLRQQYLVAKYGLLPAPLRGELPKAAEAAAPRGGGAAVGNASGAGAAAAPREVSEQILVPTLLRKQFTKPDYQEFIAMDISFNASGLDKPARAIKGVLRITDLFGEKKFALNWTINKPLADAQAAAWLKFDSTEALCESCSRSS